MIELVVEAGYLVVNPVAGVNVARQPDPEMLFLSAEEVERLAAIREPYGTLVHLLAYGGLRWGEAVAVRRKRCDLLRSRIEVAESLSEARGKLHFGPTKNYRRRMVIIPAFLSELLAEHLAREVDDDPDALVFTSPLGKPLCNSNFRRRVWYQAVEAASLPDELRIHDLRHTCAALLIAEGAHPKAIQVHLGHSSISVTMNRYGHLFPSDMELVAALDEVRSEALAGPDADQTRTRHHRTDRPIGETPCVSYTFGFRQFSSSPVDSRPFAAQLGRGGLCHEDPELLGSLSVPPRSSRRRFDLGDAYRFPGVQVDDGPIPQWLP
ncbi:MAG: tyrosine-type recombinase/integrase [Acidimicrobiia bacterium]